MRFDAQHIGSGRWGVWDGGVMSWRATDLAENEAKEKAADLNVVFDQYGQRTNAERREVRPPVAVEAATWHDAGHMDYWVKERGEWWGRVRGPDGHPTWVRAGELRRQVP